MIGITVALGCVCCGVAVVALMLYRRLREEMHKVADLRERYQGIIDVDSAVLERQKNLSDIERKARATETEFVQKSASLSAEYKQKRDVYEALTKEVAILEENLENISYGLYSPHYDFATSDEFRNQCEKAREEQKRFIKDERAVICSVDWEVGGSKVEGRRLTKQYSKVMLRAFNGECDAAVAKVKWNNVGNMEARISKAFEAINKLGSVYKIAITRPYYNSKLEELRLWYELDEKIHQEKEEQRKIREQMRDEEKALREIEKAQKDAEQEELRYQRALDKARQEVETVTGLELEKLNSKIADLERHLQEAREQKERAMSRAQLTKSGHVYVISNIGSFGENVYKIGMTRRLEPMDRIKELGDSSVPFDFDVHALIYSDNAPELEAIFHREFDDRKCNLVNGRREFFNVNLEDIERICADRQLQLQLTRIAEAKEYRETQSLREARQQRAQVNTPDTISGKFPASL